MNIVKKTFLLLLVLASSLGSAYGQLTVRTETYGSKPGYIDKATLVVEPHGAYVEQSLYLSYSDHGQFASSQVEIVHRFELPAHAVVNDLWLWIGDSVMQAVMLDTWKARAIYDSIVSRKRDPAFLSKNGSVYELHIYPLVSGKFRKVKLNFITPTRWLGTDGTAELPLKMLKDNNSLKKPLQVIFREVEHIWGLPSINERPQQVFAGVKDTTKYSYQYTDLDDISALSSFTLGFSTNFVNGFFITTSDVKNDATYFQFGFNPGSLFGLHTDTASHHQLYALDLSGVHSKNFATLMPGIKQLMRSASKPNDSINVVVAGGGKIEMLSPAWKIGNADSINNMLDRFSASAWGKQVFQEKLPNVLFADAYASTCWQFPGLENYATYKNYPDLLAAIKDLNGADVVAAYRYGYEDAGLTSSNIGTIIPTIDSFFVRGGRFLSYFDFNRVGRELIGSHYIAGLTTTRRADGSTTLYRNPTGNIGIYFPESVVHYGFDYLQYTPDPDVKIELQDKDGKPVVISKKIGNGLLVISGIWSFRDDGALRALLGVPLLGLNEVKKNQQLTGLLTELQAKYKQSAFDKILLMSNSDSLFQKTDALAWAGAYVNGFGASMPIVTTVNLLDGVGFTPPYLTDGQIQYFGSGFLLKTIATASKGRHFETHVDNWNYIVTALNAYSYPVSDSMTVSVSVDNGTGQLKELREVNPLPMDPNKARFFIGSASVPNKLLFTVRDKFAGIADEKNISTTVFVNHDTTKMEMVLPAMVGNEKLQDLFSQQNKDTVNIVKAAMQYRLLCDFTALLALEPNDTIHFLKNPHDESVLGVSHFVDESMSDSLLLLSYPNPFNSQTSIVVNVRDRSVVNAGIYNILGQLVRVLASNEMVDGKKIYHWSGDDTNGRAVSSGAYFIRLAVSEKNSGRTATRFRKILYLK